MLSPHTRNPRRGGGQQLQGPASTLPHRPFDAPDGAQNLQPLACKSIKRGQTILPRGCMAGGGTQKKHGRRCSNHQPCLQLVFPRPQDPPRIRSPVEPCMPTPRISPENTTSIPVSQGSQNPGVRHSWSLAPDPSHPQPCHPQRSPPRRMRDPQALPELEVQPRSPLCDSEPTTWPCPTKPNPPTGPAIPTQRLQAAVRQKWGAQLPTQP